MIKNGANVYIDGAEVTNPEMLNLRNYDIEFKDGSVLLTKR